MIGLLQRPTEEEYCKQILFTVIKVVTNLTIKHTHTQKNTKDYFLCKKVLLRFRVMTRILSWGSSRRRL